MRGDTEIDNSADTLDSRDIIDRIAYLRDEEGGDQFTDEEAEELAALVALAEAAAGYCADWEFGETLIRDSYFEDYAFELADSIGAIDSNYGWPLNCIDWKQAARELQQDYTSFDFDGVTYYGR
ncbi:MAG: hypothetical protein IPG34_19645 [Rhodocyclaceae bacterium]|nr:hypothetical protein [Rhodocyclaceae bacterium]